MSKVTELAKQLFGGVKDAALTIAPGLANAVPDLMAEGKRQITQSASEIASLLFNGNAYVQYGPGQQIAEPDRGPDVPPEQEREQDGMER